MTIIIIIINPKLPILVPMIKPSEVVFEPGEVVFESREVVSDELIDQRQELLIQIFPVLH
jgi:hypothetical protein